MVEICNQNRDLINIKHIQTKLRNKGQNKLKNKNVSPLLFFFSE
jgi:hypothetical protein